MQLITISEAMKITRHSTEAGFRSYIWRMNRMLPQEQRVVLCRGMIEPQSLETAVRAYHTRSRTNERG